MFLAELYSVVPQQVLMLGSDVIPTRVLSQQTDAEGLYAWDPQQTVCSPATLEFTVPLQQISFLSFIAFFPHFEAPACKIPTTTRANTANNFAKSISTYMAVAIMGAASLFSSDDENNGTKYIGIWVG